MHVLGTAGHVDHGKSSLVRALTGTDPDRWIEERLRGMTLDLGFAHLRFDDGVEAGIVDVPGHERFLHNMLAGAAGMEVLLLVVAANEGPRPQTLEHLAILQYLNVRRTIVVLTKSDLVDAEELDLARELVADAVRGTFAEGAPAVAVSTLTGDGLDAVRAAIHAALVGLAPRAPSAPAYLPVDRSFAIAGHGTVVTGTLMQGSIAAGDRLVLTPPGVDVRVRSLQVFGETRERVGGGARVAANVPAIEANEIARGAVLASAQFEAVSDLAVRFRPLPSALGLMRRRMPVRAYLGSAEVLGTLVFERAPQDASSVSARLFLREPVVVVPGLAFVVRRLSPKTLLGGGTIDDANASSESTASNDDRDDRVTPEERAVESALVAAGIGGATPASVGAAANVREDVARAALESLRERGAAYAVARPAAFVAARVADDFAARALERILEHERRAPWTSGTTALALSRALAVPEATLVRALGPAIDDGRIVARSGYIASPAHVPKLTSAQRSFFDRALVANDPSPNAPVDVAALKSEIAAAKIEGLGAAFETLIVTHVVAKVGESIYRAEQIERIGATLERALRREGEITPAAFRDLIGTSRKYALPLLEYFDVIGITIRRGDVRVLRDPIVRKRAIVTET
jgi:selenocysteine-specific elongation factor